MVSNAKMEVLAEIHKIHMVVDQVIKTLEFGPPETQLIVVPLAAELLRSQDKIIARFMEQQCETDDMLQSIIDKFTKKE